MGAHHAEVLGQARTRQPLQDLHRDTRPPPHPQRLVQPFMLGHGVFQAVQATLCALFALVEGGMHGLGLRAARPQAFLCPGGGSAHEVFTVARPHYAAAHLLRLGLGALQGGEGGAGVDVLACCVGWQFEVFKVKFHFQNLL